MALGGWVGGFRGLEQKLIAHMARIYSLAMRSLHVGGGGGKGLNGQLWFIAPWKALTSIEANSCRVPIANGVSPSKHNESSSLVVPKK